MKMDAHRPLPPVGDIRGHGTGVREGSTTSTTTPDGPGAEGEIGDYSPDATGEELETLSLQELVDQELCGGANQSGQLLMALDQHPSEFAVVNEPPPNRPTTVDWTHDVLHNLAQRVLYDTIGAQRYGHPPTVRWGAHIAAAEFRDVGRMFTRLGDMIVNSIDRPVDEPRTAPPTNEPMYRHYREWSKRWREMFLGVIREFLQHTDAEVVEHQARLRARDDHYRRMAELRDLERYRTLQRSGPEPGLGVPVARRPSGAMGGKRSHEQMTAKGGDRGRSSTDTFPGRSPLDVVPPRPKFRMPTPSPSEEIRGGRPVQTPDPRLPTPGSILGVGLASSSSWPQGWDDRAGLQEGATVAWDGPITSLTSTASSSVGRGAHVMPTTPIMPPPDNATTPRPTPLVPDQRPPVAHSDSFGVTRSSIWDQHNNPGTPTIPPVPIITAVTPVTPFDERGHPIITPIIPSAPVITSTTPMTPFPEDVPEVDEVIQEICGPLSSSSTTTTGVPGIGLPFSTSSTTTPHGADEEVDYDEPDDEQDEHIPSDEVEVTVEEDGAVTMDGYVTMTGERGMGEDDLSPREERLDRHVAGMVVAEVYHLLRTTGVIARPGTTAETDVRVTPRGVTGTSRPAPSPSMPGTSRSLPPWRWTSRRPRMSHPYTAPRNSLHGPLRSTSSTTTELIVGSFELFGLVVPGVDPSASSSPNPSTSMTSTPSSPSMSSSATASSSLASVSVNSSSAWTPLSEMFWLLLSSIKAMFTPFRT